MALSNWDTFAMGHNGNPCRGIFVSGQGVSVEIYKNWIYLKDKSWNKIGERFVRTYVMQIYDARIDYKDVCVASKFINHTIYMAVWSYKFNEDDIDEYKGMVGIGTMAHSDKEDKYVGVTDKQIKRLDKFLKTKTIIYVVQIPEILQKLDLNKGKRYNQGDMFFHDKIGLDTQCSNVGEAQDTHFGKFIKNMKVE